MEGNLIILSQPGDYEYEFELNKEFILKIEGNPTTGYNWFYNDESNSIVQPVDLNEYKTGKYESTNTGRDGAPGYLLFKFKAISSGETKLSFIYKRSWENEIRRTINVKIKIK